MKQGIPLKIRPNDRVRVRRDGDVWIYSFTVPISISHFSIDGKYLEIPKSYRGKTVRCRMDAFVDRRGKVVQLFIYRRSGPAILPHTLDDAEFCLGRFHNIRFGEFARMSHALLKLVSMISLSHDLPQEPSTVDKEFRAPFKWATEWLGEDPDSYIDTENITLTRKQIQTFSSSWGRNRLHITDRIEEEENPKIWGR